MAKSEFSCSENIVHEDAVAEVREKMHDGEHAGHGGGLL